MINCFKSKHRLKTADEFSSVFIFRKVKSGKYFKIHYKPNEFDHSRLGLVVSKKIHKRANKRNYIKRTIREFFRNSQSNWLPHDIIVRSTCCFTQEKYQEVLAELQALTSKLIKY